MTYQTTVFIIMTVILVITLLFTLPYLFISIFGGCAKRKRYPEREEKLRYGIVVAGRNEEKVIGNLIESIRKTNYPQDKLDIFVVAHNCTDRTAEVARTAGAIVYEYNNDAERTKGFALKYIFEKIKSDYGIMNYDGYIIFDADNILDGDFFSKINDAFLYYDKKNAITTFRNSKNFGTNAITACYGLTYIVSCTIESNAKMALGCSSRIQGSGFLVSNEMMKDGWTITNLSDDTDFTIEQVLEGQNVMYCDDAMYYDEHPTTFKAMWRQRLRWAKGALIVFNKRSKDLLKNLFSKKKRKSVEATNSTTKVQRGSSYLLICDTMPIGAIGVFVVILNMILIGLAPLFNASILGMLKDWGINTLIGAVIGLVLLTIVAIVSYAKESKRIKNVSFGVKLASILYWPIFVILLIPLQIQAMFTKKFEWKPIKHDDSSNFDTFNNAENQEVSNTEDVTK